MNRIAGRSKFALILAAVLVLGLVIFLGEYLFQAKDLSLIHISEPTIH